MSLPRPPAALALTALLACCSAGGPAASPGAAAAPVPPPAPDVAQAAPARARAKPGIPSDPAALAPGASRTAVEGCLAARTESDGARFPVPPVTRAAPAPAVTVALVPGGLVVSHALSHACCLAAEVTTGQAGDQVTVTERLTGTPCRCMCSSTLRTAVGLRPGTFALAVELDQGRGTQRVYAGPVTVR